MHCG